MPTFLRGDHQPRQLTQDCSPGLLKLAGGQIQAGLPHRHSMTLQAQPVPFKALAQRLHICWARPKGFCPEAFCQGGSCPKELGCLGLRDPGVQQGVGGNGGMLGLPPGGGLGKLQVLQGRAGGGESIASCANQGFRVWPPCASLK